MIVRIQCKCRLNLKTERLIERLEIMSIMSVQIQCKGSLNQGLTDKLKG